MRAQPGAARPGQLWPLLVVVAGVLLGLVIGLAGTSSWRFGSIVIGLSLLAGAVLRLVLGRDAGLLQVRGRAFDVVVLLLAGVAVVVLAVAVPPAR